MLYSKFDFFIFNLNKSLNFNLIEIMYFGIFLMCLVSYFLIDYRRNGSSFSNPNLRLDIIILVIFFVGIFIVHSVSRQLTIESPATETVNLKSKNYTERVRVVKVDKNHEYILLKIGHDKVKINRDNQMQYYRINPKNELGYYLSITINPKKFNHLKVGNYLTLKKFVIKYKYKNVAQYLRNVRRESK